MPIFTSNYPFYQPGQTALMSTPERTKALPEYTGRGVVMAFIDAGFYPHPDLAGRILMHVDASTNHVVEQNPAAFEPSDLSWHGQMTTVIAAGDGQTSAGQYRGIAHDAQLVLIKVSTPHGQIKECDILRGLRWLVDAHARFGIKIVNISVGGDFVSTDSQHPIYRAVSKLVATGITIIVSGGNRGLPHVVPPASAPDVITVGGINDHNSLERSLWELYNHNYGVTYEGTVKPDLLAPAIWIASPILPGSTVAREARWLSPLLWVHQKGDLLSILERGYADLGLTHQMALYPDDHLFAMLQSRIYTHKLIDAHHQHVDGTSVAAPIVSAIAAQMLEANPCLTPLQIRAILTATAEPLPNLPAERQGAGVVNAAQAVLTALDYLKVQENE